MGTTGASGWREMPWMMVRRRDELANVSGTLTDELDLSPGYGGSGRGGT